MLEQDARFLKARRLCFPDHFLGDFYGDKQLTVEWLLCALPKVPPGLSELMSPPGLADAELLARSSYAAQREREVVLLYDPRVVAAVKDLGVERVTFGVLAQSR